VIYTRTLMILTVQIWFIIKIEVICLILCTTAVCKFLVPILVSV